MRFFALAVAAIAASLTSAAAVPAAEPANEIDARRNKPVNFKVTGFFGNFIPHSSDARYHFFVSGESNDPHRSFPKTRCHAIVSSGRIYQNLIPVRETKCEDPSVTFSWQKASGETPGWVLEVGNRYQRKPDAPSPVYDKAAYFFPKDHIGYADAGTTGAHHYVKGPKNFEMHALLVGPD